MYSCRFEIDRVEYRTDDGRVDVAQRPQPLSAEMLARLERADDEDSAVDERRDDRRVGHGDERRAVDDDAVESRRPARR